MKLLIRERKKEFYFTLVKPWYGHMAATFDNSMLLRLQDKSKVQAFSKLFYHVWNA